MSEDIRQGGLANIGGKTLERILIENLLASKGLKPVPYSDYIKNPSEFGDELLLKNVPYTTIYNHRGFTEYKILSRKYGLEIRLECKWQQSSGSVDEKFPYLYLNCIETMPEKDIIIIYGGRGAKPGSIEWLKSAAKNKLFTDDKNRNKSVRVFNLEEFVSWANILFR